MRAWKCDSDWKDVCMRIEHGWQEQRFTIDVKIETLPYYSI